MLKAVLSKHSLAYIFSILHCKKNTNSSSVPWYNSAPPHVHSLPTSRSICGLFLCLSVRIPRFFSPGLSPQPDNACRSAALYGSIKIPLLFAGEVKCGKCDVCGPRVVQAQCFQMTFAVPPALCFAAATYIRTSISTEAYVQVGEAETPVCTKQESCGCAA